MINYHKIILDIEKLIAGDVDYDSKTLEKYSKDASLFSVRPQVVIFPKDKFDIQAIVKYVSGVKRGSIKQNSIGKGLSITARAAGTDMSGGPINDSIILDVTRYMNKVGRVGGGSAAAPTISCEPGVYFRDLEKYLNNFNLMYPSYPASKDLCCVGGIVANNSSGEKTLLYGSTIDWIKEIEMVLHEGTIYNFKETSFDELEEIIKQKSSKTIPEIVSKIYLEIFDLINENQNLIINSKPKVSKNSSGYFLWSCIDWQNKKINLAKLICGSQGTLGIITKVKLGLVERPKYSQMLTVLLPDLKNLVPVVEEILKFKPESVESFDDHTFKLAMRFLPTIMWKLKGSIFQLGISFLPEVWMALSGGIPRLILMAEFTGHTQKEADQKANQALQKLKKFPYKSRVAKNEIEVQKYWLFRRESFNLLRNKLKGYKVAPFVEDLIVPRESTPEFLPALQKILDKNKFTYSIAGHAGSGNFHIFPMMKLDSEEEIKKIKAVNQEVFSLVEKYHGSISAEHNDGLVRTPYLYFMFNDEMLKLFDQVKNIFDPLNIFNPGKKVGGSVEGNYSKIELQK